MSKIVKAARLLNVSKQYGLGGIMKFLWALLILTTSVFAQNAPPDLRSLGPSYLDEPGVHKILMPKCSGHTRDLDRLVLTTSHRVKIKKVQSKHKSNTINWPTPSSGIWNPSKPLVLELESDFCDSIIEITWDYHNSTSRVSRYITVEYTVW